MFYDALSLTSLSCATSVAATEVVRTGSPPNPTALLTGVSSGPVLGSVWDPAVDHTSFATTAIADLLAVTPNAINLPLPPHGTLLVNPAVVITVEVATPGQPFALPVPADCALAGLALFTQGASLFAGGAFVFTNALDITLGTF